MLSHSLLEGEIVEGKHEKLVSKELFLKANGEKSKIPHGYKANPLNDELPLKLFFKCESCKEYLRGYIVKAKGLYYYKCNHGSRCSCNVSAKQLHSLFETILNELNLTKEDVEPFKAQLRKVYNALNTEKEEHQQQYKLKVRELEDKIERLEERFINEEIKADLYEKFSAKFRKERAELDAFASLTLYSNSNLEKYLSRSLDFLVELPSLWASSGYKEKQELQQTIFPEGIFYSKKNRETRTTKINSVFALIARQKGLVEEKETGISEVIFKNSGLVARTRIELVSRV
jgi:site-specific DNA recombinase